MQLTKQKTQTTYLQMKTELKADIVDMAEADDRTITNMISVLLKEAMEARKARA